MSKINLNPLPELKHIDRCDTIMLLLTSLALEEIALAHVVNAEAEKIQAVLGALSGQRRCRCCPIDVQPLLDVNDSVSRTLRETLKKDILLELKLQDILEMTISDGFDCDK